MKIKRLKLKNINSFYGEFEIDFEKFDSLFLITGPTGSGKTTVIDAILAALYNKTPRLKHSKHLLNKDAKEGEIVLVFSVNNEEYKIEWKAKKRKNDIEVKRRFFKDTLLADKDKEIKEAVLKVLKLDFNQFTKSVVLAQGEFDAFLSADSNEKMEVLEKILGVEEFERVSIKVFEKTKELKNKKEEILEQIEELKVDSLEEKENLLKEKLKTLQKVDEELIKTQESLIRYNEKKKAEKKVEEINQELQGVSEKMKELNFYDFKEKATKKIYALEDKKSHLEEEFRVVEEEFLKEVRLNELSKRLKAKEKEIERIKKIIEKNKNELINLKEKKEEFVKALEKTEKDILKSEALENFEKISEIYREIEFLRKEYKKSAKSINEMTFKKKVLEEKLKEKNDLLESLMKDLEYLEAKALVLKYEKERALLKENMPCPLCGSTEHPYVKKAPEVEKDIKKRYEKTKKLIESVENEIKHTELELRSITDILEKEKKKLTEIIEEGDILSKELKKFETDENRIKELFEQKKKNDELLKKKEEISKLILMIDSKIEEKKIGVKEYEKILNSLYAHLKEISNEAEKIELKIKSPSLRKKVLEEETESLNSEIESIKKEIDNKRREFEKLITRLHTLRNFLKPYESMLNSLILMNVQERDYEGEKKELEEKKDALNQEIGYLKKEIEEIKIKLQKIEILNKELASLDKDLRVYEKLNSKIGSADGKAFKKIAINYMMDALLFMANEELEILSDGRYVLQKSEDLDKLDLFVVDRFYANSIRGINTLSGGEKFLVSLALSFGLSNMVKNSINIENMFLDEGFGTLDEKNLNKALDMLLNIANTKRIGIISHVEKLKDEIDKQIVVEKNGGRSRLRLVY